MRTMLQVRLEGALPKYLGWSEYYIITGKDKAGLQGKALA